ncbi:MAG: hypothetical protein ACO3RG_05340, partial [Nitriliruptoraceae bacterium]
VWRIGSRVLKNWVMGGIAAAAFVGIYFLGLPFPLIILGAGAIGLAGALHPDEADRRDLPDGTVAAELLVEPLLAVLPAAGPDPARAPLLVRHPAVVVDVAVVAPETVPLAEVEAAVRRGAGELLDGLRWFDEFRGTQLPDGHRSLGFRLRLQDPERQLTDADAEAVLAGVGTAVAAIGAALRG